MHNNPRYIWEHIEGIFSVVNDYVRNRE